MQVILLTIREMEKKCREIGCRFQFCQYRSCILRICIFRFASMYLGTIMYKALGGIQGYEGYLER